MKKIALLLALAAAGACAGQPTAPAAANPSGSASQNGGLMLGSGHRSDADSTSTTSSNTTSGNGGLMLGSGHRSQADSPAPEEGGSVSGY